MIYQDITEAIGDTPLVRLDPDVTGLDDVEVYVKLEYQNPFGSIKDRVAWELVRPDLDRIQDAGLTLLESSSGNTAKALQAVAGNAGLSFRTITNRIKIDAVKDTLLLMGAEITELPGTSECPDPNDPDDPLSYLDRLMAREGDAYYRTDQYTSERNTRIHRETTGAEIREDLGHVDHLFGGLGTTGSTKGVAQALREQNPDLAVTGIVASQDGFIPGIRTADEMWEIGLYEPELYDERMVVDAGDAVEGMLILIREAGILAGPTTGANFVAMQRRLQDITVPDGETRTAVLFACDRAEPYIEYVRRYRPEIFGDDEREHLEEIADDPTDVDELDVQDLIDMSEQADPLIIDSRTNQAFRMGYIPGSINVPEEQLREMLETGTPFPEDRPLVFVCPGGRRSRKFAALAGIDRDRVYSLAPGINGWRDTDRAPELQQV